MATRLIPFISASGHIRSVEYDDEKQELTITFATGSYRYFDVPKETADGFAESKSAGGYLDVKIKKVGFKYERLF